jgi:hypothetical protein
MPSAEIHAHPPLMRKRDETRGCGATEVWSRTW